MAERPIEGQSLLILKATRSHSDTLESVGLLWTIDQPVQRPLPDNTQHSQETDNPWSRRDSNPQSQQSTSRRPTP